MSEFTCGDCISLFEDNTCSFSPETWLIAISSSSSSCERFCHKVTGELHPATMHRLRSTQEVMTTIMKEMMAETAEEMKLIAKEIDEE